MIKTWCFSKLAAACAVTMALCAGPVAAQNDAFRMIALGDMPYGPREKSFPLYLALIDEINQRNPDIAVHVGDTRYQGECSNDVLKEQRQFMNQFEAPLIYTPGDNEWTDCHTSGGGWNDPLDRLDYIRKAYFGRPDRTLGKRRLGLDHQAALGYPENARLQYGNIGIISAHIVGSNNNFVTRDITAVQEYFARSAASTNWLKEGFATYRKTEAIIVIIHADMFFHSYSTRKEQWSSFSGFRQFGTALKNAARAYDKPVLLVYGDGHEYTVSQPFPKTAPNVTGVEVYGHHDMHAVEITVTPRAKDAFTFTKVKNPWLP